MDGRSSWIKDMVCMNSMAQAEGRACSMLPPTNSQAARQRAGRTRFPPASKEYLHRGVLLNIVETLPLVHDGNDMNCHSVVMNCSWLQSVHGFLFGNLQHEG